jgi:hypothetical protein
MNDLWGFAASLLPCLSYVNENLINFLSNRDKVQQKKKLNICSFHSAGDIRNIFLHVIDFPLSLVHTHSYTHIFRFHSIRVLNEDLWLGAQLMITFVVLPVLCSFVLTCCCWYWEFGCVTSDGTARASDEGGGNAYETLNGIKSFLSPMYITVMLSLERVAHAANGNKILQDE